MKKVSVSYFQHW